MVCQPHPVLSGAIPTPCRYLIECKGFTCKAAVDGECWWSVVCGRATGVPLSSAHRMKHSTRQEGMTLKTKSTWTTWSKGEGMEVEVVE